METAMSDDLQRVRVEYLGEHRFRASNQAGFALNTDGGDPAKDLKPMEILLAALGGCTGIDVVDIMRKKRTPLARYRIEIEGVRALDHPRRFLTITVRHVGSGPDVTEAAFQHAVGLSHERYCSVSASLSATVRAEIHLEPWSGPSGA
ncbi:OsmC family protein [mine drainage metagenome]|uniref:OsmC family protein n=1 Tax=mine drainage metagenome TaxID=410659 RepID=T1D784_9ZZZZ